MSVCWLHQDDDEVQPGGDFHTNVSSRSQEWYVWCLSSDLKIVVLVTDRTRRLNSTNVLSIRRLSRTWKSCCWIIHWDPIMIRPIYWLHMLFNAARWCIVNRFQRRILSSEYGPVARYILLCPLRIFICLELEHVLGGVATFSSSRTAAIRTTTADVFFLCVTCWP